MGSLFMRVNMNLSLTRCLCVRRCLFESTKPWTGRNNVNTIDGIYKTFSTTKMKQVAVSCKQDTNTSSSKPVDVNVSKTVEIDETDKPVKLSADIEKFCEKYGMSKQQFASHTVELSKKAKMETIQHMSIVADIITEYGYRIGVKYILKQRFNLLNQTSIQHLRSVLEEHDDNEEVGEEIQHMPDILRQFPSTKLGEDAFESFVEYFDVDERVLSACFRSKKFVKSQADCTREYKRRVTDCLQYMRRVNILEEAGINKMEILENADTVMALHVTPEKLVKAIQEQKKILGEVNLTALNRLLLPRTTSGMILTRLFKCSFNQFTKEEMDYFKYKSKVNAAEVFYLLIDEGFQSEEIRNHIYLLGAEESRIRQYLNDNGKMADKWASLEEGSSNIVVTLPDIGEDFESKGPFSRSLTGSEKFLQRMQVALEFPNSNN